MYILFSNPAFVKATNKCVSTPAAYGKLPKSGAAQWFRKEVE